MSKTKSTILSCLFIALNFGAQAAATTTASEYRQLGLLYRQQGCQQEAIAAIYKKSV